MCVHVLRRRVWTSACTRPCPQTVPWGGGVVAEAATGTLVVESATDAVWIEELVLSGGRGVLKTTCLLSSQACVRSGRHPVLSGQRPAPRAALRQRGRLAPLLALRGCRLGAGLPDPNGQLAHHPDAVQPAGPTDPGAKRDFRLASETAFAQVLPCL